MVVQEPVRAAIWYALNNYNYDDAIFLAERLHAEVGSLDSSYLLATCYFRSGRVQQARHVLGQHRGEPQCALLYARCCLQLSDLKSGLLALNGLLCLGEEREDEVAARFGDDRGVAFWLLGELNRRLHQPKEAAKHFRSCLRFNPFLWTAYQALCEIGESVPPEECFKISELPAFLRTSRGDPIPNTAHLVAGGAPTATTQEALKPLDNVAAGISERRSAFTPVDPSKPALVTPGLFGNPQLGQAVASSTPVPRALAFTTTTEKKPRDKGADTVTPFALGGGAKPGGRIDSLGGLRGALSFGSGRPTGRGRGRGGITPVSPSFGALLPTLYSGSTQCGALLAKHSLNFSTITPSPTSLPPNYLSALQSAQKSTRSAAGKTPLPLAGPRFNLHFDSPSETPDSQSFPTPDSSPAAAARSETPESPNDISPVSSRDSASPPAGDTPSMPPPKAPAKTATLRRSARLSGIGKSPSSMAISRRRPEITPSSLALHSTRAKSRLKPPVDRVRGTLTGGKGHRVTFTTPVTNRKGRTYAVTPAPLGGLNSDSLGPPAEEPLQQEPQTLPGSGAGAPGDGVMVVGECGSDTQRSLELAALAGIGSLLQLLAQIGSAYHSLCQYDLLAAVRGFRSLPPQHHHTPWVLSQLARAFFVGERLRESAKVFEDVHRMDPHRQEGMELYASILWHLQRETELSVLAESLHTSNRRRPEALCAMATVMNTYKDHESAVKFLQRAIQVSPQFAYAHTLLGHEHWLIKDYDKSLASFQTATTIDPRHYNAWYGMAHVYYTQEKYRFAEVYAGRALAINKASSIACTQLALAQFRQNSLPSSLLTLERAMALNPNNPIPRFHRAKVLEAMGRLEEALQQLEQLTVMWPREPSLCVAKGKLLKQLNRPHEAVLQFSWALEFNRGGSANQIRDELDQAYPSQDSSVVEQDDRDFTPHFDPEQGSDDSDGSMHS